MGREIRRVPKGWEHPQEMSGRGVVEYVPLYDRDYETEASEWLAGLMAWEAGTHEGRAGAGERYYWDWGGDPPNRESCRPKWTTEPTWFQVYETVSEGTPVTPAFETKDEVIAYLVRNGDFWDQKRGDGGWPRAAAERFVSSEHAPSLIVVQSPTGSAVLTPRDMEAL